jgi:hypothetical protein
MGLVWVGPVQFRALIATTERRRDDNESAGRIRTAASPAGADRCGRVAGHDERAKVQQRRGRGSRRQWHRPSAASSGVCTPGGATRKGSNRDDELVVGCRILATPKVAVMQWKMQLRQA